MTNLSSLTPEEIDTEPLMKFNVFLLLSANTCTSVFSCKSILLPSSNTVCASESDAVRIRSPSYKGADCLSCSQRLRSLNRRCTVLYFKYSRSEEHTSELQSPDHLVC